MAIKLVSWNDYVRLCLSYAKFTINEDSSWTVEIPPLPGCVTWGETRAEALMMAEDAIHSWLVVALRLGDEIPIIDGCTLDWPGAAKETIATILGRYLQQDIPRREAISLTSTAWVELAEHQHLAMLEDLVWALAAR